MRLPGTVWRQSYKSGPGGSARLRCCEGCDRVPAMRSHQGGRYRPRGNTSAAKAWLAGIAGLLLVAGLVFAMARHPSAGGGSGVGLDVGAAVPTLSLPSTTGSQISLSAYRGKKVILYFYEGAG